MNLAPIGLSAYTRINHLKQTVEALRSNTLARLSELYVFSDAPRPGDEDKVAIVREFLRTIDGFRNVSIVERKENGRTANSRSGIGRLLEEYGKCVYMEEDIVTAPGFLQFMNDALDFYEGDPRMLSVSGYSPPLPIRKGFAGDVYLLRRLSGWGVGFWKDKYHMIAPVSREEFDHLVSNRKMLRKFVQYGDDMVGMLRKEVTGEIDTLDVKAMYWQYRLNMFTLYPRYSLTRNIGHDGSGVHCGVTRRFDTDLWEKRNGFVMKRDLSVDRGIVRLNREFRRVRDGGKGRQGLFRRIRSRAGSLLRRER
jgi:hypothetical protein